MSQILLYDLALEVMGWEMGNANWEFGMGIWEYWIRTSNSHFLSAFILKVHSTYMHLL
jgi:hypothetical protein